MGNVVVDIEGVSKKLKHFQLDSVHLQVQEGTCVALLGPNGSGKSTFFRIIMNLLHVQAGSIRLFGQQWTENETDLKNAIGFVGGQYDILGDLSVAELASLVSYWYSSWSREMYIQLLERYQVDERIQFKNCSKGTQKKVEFIFAIAHQPSLLLLDEPTSGVDIISRRRMKEDLLSFMENGDRSIVLATHQVDEVRDLCDYIYVLHQGRVVDSFIKDEIRENWARLRVSLLTPTIEGHPSIKAVDRAQHQLVTSDLHEMESFLEQQKVSIAHMERLAIDEVLEYLIDKQA